MEFEIMNNNYQPLPKLLPEDIIARAKKLNAALLCDGMKDMGIPMDGCMEAAIMPVNPKLKMVGTAMTISTDLGDNFPIHVATYSGSAGYVMVIDGKGYTERPYFGDLIMGAAQAIGYEGIVIDGYTRDTSGCLDMGFPVYSKGIMQRGVLKQNPGELNVPIKCGGITVNPGDLVVGDADGITVVPRDKVYEVLEKAEEKAAYEDAREEKIAEYRHAVAEGKEPPQLAPQWVLDLLNKIGE
jgi:regulator of RNase E activity RraA